jgi:hypothetical protein
MLLSHFVPMYYIDSYIRGGVLHASEILISQCHDILLNLNHIYRRLSPYR